MTKKQPNPFKSQLRYVERQGFWQQPDCYDGPNCDKQRPTWWTSYPKEGNEEDGEELILKIPASSMPPGSRVTIEVPCCPVCGDPADMNEGKGMRGKPPNHKRWPNCDCGFSWGKWVENQFS